MKVLVADDHPMIRRGVRESVQEAFPAAAIIEAGNGDDAVAAMTEGDVDLVFMDIEMPGKSGLDAMREARKVRPELPILIMSMHDEIEYGLRALRCGAAGYVSKRAPAEVIARA